MQPADTRRTRRPVVIFRSERRPGDSSPQAPLTPIFLLFFLSGATSLVYEVLWLRQLILIFGSTLFATSATLATFMGGLALGAFLGGRLIDRRPPSPLRAYGVLEIAIGAYALAVPFFFDQLTPIYRWIWQAGGSESFFLFSLAKFVGIAAVLLPPTALMGASLPVLALQVADDPLRIGGRVGALYAVNTFGAVAGVFLAGFVAVPSLGVQRTVWATAAANFLLGVVAVVLARGYDIPRGDAVREAARTTLPRSREVRLALVAFGVSGFAAMVLEVAWTRGLALVMGSSVYAFSLMLLAFLIGLAVGSASFSAFLRRRPEQDPKTLLALLLGSTGVLAYGTTFVLQTLPRLFAETYLAWKPSATSMFAIELAFGLLVMFPATFTLGGIFPTVLQLHARSLKKVAGSVGVVYASNTVGTILGAFAGGFVLVPWLGVRDTVVAVSALEIVFGLLVAWSATRGAARTRAALAAPMAAAIVLIPVLRPGWDNLLMNSGVYYYIQDLEPGQTWRDYTKKIYDDREIIYLKEGLTSTVVVVDQPKHNNRYLSVNGKVEASSKSDLETQVLCAHLPLLMHPDPRDVLVIGLASGITAGSAATHPIDSIRVVEVEEAMIEAARLFAKSNGNVLDDPRLSLSINDARNELDFSEKQYDVIISEPSNPFMTVAANLFTEDFFRMARRRVKPGGIFAQWIQAYCLPPEDLRSIIAAFRSAFPKILIFQLGGVDLVMLGSEEPLRFDLPALATRMAELRVWSDLGRVRVREPMDLLTYFELGDAEVDVLVEDAPRNTDDNARVEHSAPKAFALHTTNQNSEMLRSLGGDPLEYLIDPPESVEAWSPLVLQLAEAWLRRGNVPQAAVLARAALDTPAEAEAKELLDRLSIAMP